MCFVLKQAGSHCIEMVLCTVDQFNITVDRIGWFCALALTICLVVWTLVLYWRWRGEGEGASLRRFNFTVYDSERKGFKWGFSFFFYFLLLLIRFYFCVFFAKFFFLLLIILHINCNGVVSSIVWSLFHFHFLYCVTVITML